MQRRNNAQESGGTSYEGNERYYSCIDFLQDQCVQANSYTTVCHGCVINVGRLCVLVVELHPTFHDAVQENHQHVRDEASKGNLSNFVEEVLVLVARNNFHAG